MKRLARILIIAAALAFMATPAAADPISITLAIVGAVSWTTAIVSSVTLAISLGANLLLRKKPKPVGQRLDLTIGGDNPLAIGFGKYVTAGQLIYAGSWGNDGKTPNAYLTQVIHLSDVPIDGLAGLFANGERVNISGAAAPQGTPVTQYRVGGKDHLWVKFYDGTQGAADSFLTSTFASAQRPWTTEYVGRGRAYAIVTMLYNREVFNSAPQFRWELRGVKLYDPRKDATAGGAGAHREDNPATWEYSNNAALIERAIYKGVRYGDEWVYGGQTISSARLPNSAWIAAANEGFIAGGEVECEVEPADALEGFMQARGGRVAEVGGVYKPRSLAPSAAVWSFTDDDVIVSEGQQLTPFETLQQRHNKVTASYPEPAEAWTLKPAPPRIDAAAVARERGKELTLNLDLRLVPSGDQAQQLMTAALNEAQRLRQHRFALPPIAWLLEPGDVIAWTSARNGYDAKLFRIEEMAGRRSLLQNVALREIDPADYDWSPEDVIPVVHNPIVIIRPPAQEMTGFQVFPASYEDAGGNGYPSIEIRYDNDLDDVREIRVQVRLAEDESLVFDGTVPYDPETDRIILNAVFLPDTDYEVRAKYLPFSARATQWSAWLSVTTPDTRFIVGVGAGSIDFDKLTDDARAHISWLAERARTLEEEAQNLHRLVGEMQLEDWDDRRVIREEIRVSADNISAAYTNLIITQIGPGSALVGRIETVEASVSDVETGLDALGFGLTDLEARVETAEGAITVNATELTSLSASLTAAEGDITGNATAISALDTRVTSAEGTVTTQSSQIASLESAVTTAEGDISANAGAINALDTRVDVTEADISAAASALIGINAATGGNVANARFGMQVATTPSDALARLALKVSASGGGALSEAGIFLDALTGGQSRVVIAANKLLVQSSLGSKFAPFIIDDDVVYMDKARIRELTADNFDMNAAVTVGMASGGAGETSSSSSAFTNITGLGGMTREFDKDSAALFLFYGLIRSSIAGGGVRVITRLQDVHSGQGTRIISGALTHTHFKASGSDAEDRIAFGITAAPMDAGIHTLSVQWQVLGGGTATIGARKLAIIGLKGASFSGLTGDGSDSGGGSGGGGGGGGGWGGGALP